MTTSPRFRNLLGGAARGALVAVMAALPTLVVTRQDFTYYLCIESPIFNTSIHYSSYPQIYLWFILCGIAAAWGALSGLLRAGWGGIVVWRSLLVWATVMTLMSTVPEAWLVYPSFLHLHTRTPDQASALALQFGVLCAVLDLTLEGLPVLLRQARTRQCLYQGACIGAAIWAIYSGTILGTAIFSDPVLLNHAGEGQFDLGVLRVGRAVILGFGMAGALAGLLTTAAAYRPVDSRDPRRMADSLLFATILWIGTNIEIATAVIPLPFCDLQRPNSVYSLVVTPMLNGHVRLQCIILGLSMALVFMCVAVLTRTIESGETSCVDPEQEGSR